MGSRRRKAVVEISQDGKKWVDVSDIVIPDDLGITETASGMGYARLDAMFVAFENDRTRPVLTGCNGKTLYVRRRSEGAGSGKPQEVFSGPCEIRHKFSQRRKERLYDVRISIDGPKEESEQS